MKITKGNCRKVLRDYHELPTTPGADGSPIYNVKDLRRPIGPKSYHYTVGSLLQHHYEFAGPHKEFFQKSMKKHRWLDGKKTTKKAKAAMEEMLNFCEMDEKSEPDEAVRVAWQIKLEKFCYNTCVNWRNAGLIVTKEGEEFYKEDAGIPADDISSICDRIERFAASRSNEDIQKNVSRSLP